MMNIKYANYTSSPSRILFFLQLVRMRRTTVLHSCILYEYPATIKPYPIPHFLQFRIKYSTNPQWRDTYVSDTSDLARAFLNFLRSHCPRRSPDFFFGTTVSLLVTEVRLSWLKDRAVELRESRDAIHVRHFISPVLFVRLLNDILLIVLSVGVGES